MRGRLAPEAMYPAGTSSVRARRVTLPSGITLRVAESGDASARPVVLLHGWGASLYMWRAWFAPLVAAGFRAIAIDLPGHGLSDKDETPGAYTLAHLVDVVRELFEIEGLDGAATVAQSMAGTIALELAFSDRSPVGRLALVNPAAFGHIHLQRLARFVSPAMLDVVAGHLVPRWIVARAHRLVYVDASRITARDIDEYWAPSQFAGYARAMRRLLHEFQWQRDPADRMAKRLSSLREAPLLILAARDRLVRNALPYARAVKRAGATFALVEIEQGGHAVNEEEPALVLPTVLNYLC